MLVSVSICLKSAGCKKINSSWHFEVYCVIGRRLKWSFKIFVNIIFPDELTVDNNVKSKTPRKLLAEFTSWTALLLC